MAATVYERDNCSTSLLNSLLDFAPLFFHNLVFASARVRQLSRFRNPGHFLLVESGIQAFRVWIPSKTTGMQNPCSADKVFGIYTWNLEYTSWNPEFKIVLDSLK